MSAKLGLGLVAVVAGLGVPLLLRSRARRRGLGGDFDEDMAAYTRKRKFQDLVREQDPDALMIAEDFALENGLKLSEISEYGRDGRAPSDRSIDAASGGFTLSPLDPADAPLQRVDWEVLRIKPPRRWRAEKANKGYTRPKYQVGYRVWWNSAKVVENLKFEEVVGPVSARRRATAIAWAIAKNLKRLPAVASTEIVDDATRAGSHLTQLPPELLGRKRRRRSRQRS